MSQEKMNGGASESFTAVLSNSALPPRIGRIVRASQSRTILVRWGDSGAKEARAMSGISYSDLSKPENRGREVLLLFENGDPERPIIMGFIANPLDDLIAIEVPSQSAQEPTDMVVDGKRLTFEAQEEIVLKCGPGSITLRKDGKIIIKGTHLLSRASGPNRIKGGSVQIN